MYNKFELILKFNIYIFKIKVKNEKLNLYDIVFFEFTINKTPTLSNCLKEFSSTVILKWLCNSLQRWVITEPLKNRLKKIYLSNIN